MNDACGATVSLALPVPGNFSLPVVLWTQQSNNWWNLRGIAGNVSAWVAVPAQPHLQYVESRWNLTSRVAVDYDRMTGVVYWSQPSSDSPWSLGAQPVVDALSRKSNTSTMEFLSSSSWEVSGLAVDWFTGNVYVTDTGRRLIAVTRYDVHDSDLYRILITSGLHRPTTIALDPYLGRMFWLDNIVIKSATLEGGDLATIVDGPPNAIHPVALCVDSDRQRLYWTDREYRSISTSSYDGTDVILYRSTSPNAGKIVNLAVHQNYLFATTGARQQLEVYDKLKASRLLQAMNTDSHLFDVTIVVRSDEPSHECDTLDCEHFCINEGQQRGHCECKQGHSLQIDGRHCEASEPRYIYSIGSSLVLAEVSIDARQPDDIRAWQRVVVSDRGRVQALATHVERALVYFSDTETGAVYRTDRTEWEVAELTVQQPHVEGIAVHWEDNIVFWSDMNLGHIMYSQLDGRYHAFLLTGLNKPKALAIDPVEGMLYWSVGGAGDAARYIHRTTLGGAAAADNVERFVDVSDNITSAAAAVQDIIIDVRTRSLFWCDFGGGVVSAVHLTTRQKRILVSSEYSDRLYGVTVFQNYVTWTNGSDPIQFVVDGVGGVRKLNVNFNDTYSVLPPQNESYAIMLLDRYLQPDVTSVCKSESGTRCQHHCISVQQTSRCSCAIGFTLNDDQRSCDTSLATESFLLFTDPYHKQVYQLPTADRLSDELPVVRGVAMPTDAQFPTSVDVSADQGLVYWIDSTRRQILSTHFTDDQHKVVVNLPQGSSADRLAFSKVTGRLYYTDRQTGSINVVDVQQSDAGPQQLITGLTNPLPIAAHPQQKTIYWAEGGMVKMSMDGDSEIQVLAENLGNVTSIDASREGVLYAVDNLGARILAINPNTGAVTVVYQAVNDIQPHTVAASHQYIYFSAWNRKGIYRVSRRTESTEEAQMIGEAVFARITDLKYVEKMGKQTGTGINLLLIIILAAAGLLLLLAFVSTMIAIIAWMRRRRRQKATDHEALDASSSTETDSFPDSSTNAQIPAAPPPLVSNSPHEAKPEVQTVMAEVHVYDDVIGNMVGSSATGSLPITGDETGSSELLIGDNSAHNGHPSVSPPSGGFTTASVADNVYPLPQRATLPGVTAATSTSAEPLPGLGPERPRPAGPSGRYVYIPPKLHREPRGWAPASHAVPAPVKRTWGRAKAKAAVQGENSFTET